ncbi:MAG TPA: carbamoyltransferase [Opitutaceae bacterium]|nr:carbamoyltransferase [Opitutaceae bacterium]
MKAILGISGYYHDSAAVLVVDGRVAAAAQEERFTRIKHDSSFPSNAVDYCLRHAGIGPGELDHVVFYEKPFLKFERLLETHMAVAPRGFRAFCMAMPVWIHEKLRLSGEMRKGLGGLYKGRYVYVEHHEAHAASAFFPSPFEEAAVLTMDGVGEWATASIGHGKGNRLELSQEMRFPHSLGLLYSAFTYFCGFRVNSGEYKLMGLAPFGVPRYADLITERLMDLREDGSFRLAMDYFDYCGGLTMTSKAFDRLFGGPPRQAEAPITPRECDLAASIQKVTEEVMLRMARHAHVLTGSKNLCLAGGVALNCVGNGRLLRDSPFENIWIQPAAGDAGGALGAALFTWHQLLENPRSPESPDAQQGSLLGPSYPAAETEAFLRGKKAVYRHYPAGKGLCTLVAKLASEGNVIGWMQGRMEFGPRALGSRSILGDARNPKMQSVMNLKIKFRESFRPFAPIVLRERVRDYFDLKEGADSPYMLLVAQVNGEKRSSFAEDSAVGLGRINEVRSSIPAVTHVDGSARIQTVDRERNPRLTELLEAFDAVTACPVMINTSFNVRGEPLVCTPADAYTCFMATDIDVLVIDDVVLLKTEQPAGSSPDRSAYLGKFNLD